MLISPWILPHSGSENGRAKISRAASEDICIPAQLQATVPACALGCLQSFVLNNYSNHTCSSTADLSFLCTNPTYSGLTIGEGSLQCVVSNCFDFNAQTQSGYTICDGMASAIPNLLGTITATISAIDSLTASQSLVSITPEMSFPASPATTTEPSTSTASQAVSGETISFAPTTASTSSPNGLTTSVPPPFVIPTVSATSESPSAASTTRAPHTSSSGITSQRRSTSSSSQSSFTSTGTSTAVNVPAEKNSLSTSAIAGIAAASIVVIALVIGYLAYFLLVKRRARGNRRSQRLSGFFPPVDDHDTGGSGSATVEGKDTTVNSPDRRFYAGEIEEPKRSSFSRRSIVAPHNIGIAVAPAVFHGQRQGKNPSRPYLTLFPVQYQRHGPTVQEDRWSIASLEEGLEAQTQDVHILASPKSRSSARSFSSARVPKPPILRLSKVPPSTQNGKSRLALTPVYDNGNFDPPIPQSLSDPSMSTGPVETAPHSQISAKNEPRNDNRPFWSQNRQTLQRFPIKIALDSRKRSEPSTRSISVYTEIEEDSTPEFEEDKQLAVSRPAPTSGDRTPLRDLAWPQVPRSASIAKQAIKPQSPRKIPIMVDINAERSETVPTRLQDKPILARNETSTTTIQTESSASPVFPLPPNRSMARSQACANGGSLRQISNAYKAKACPVTTKISIRTSDQAFGQSNSFSDIRKPGQTYQDIQRLRTGRPLAQGLSSPDLPPAIPLRSPLRGRAPPFPANTNGRYPRMGVQRI